MKRRAALLFGIVCFIFTGLYLWLGLIASRPVLQATGQTQSTRTLTVYSGRGTIYDCNLEPLTNRNASYRAAVIPTAESIERLQGHCDRSDKELQTLLENGSAFVCTVDQPTLASEEILVFSVPERYDGTAAHILGYLDGNGKGVSGMEASYDARLSQEPYTVSYRVDATGRAISFTGINEPEQSAGGVVLTIDRELQQLCEEAGKTIEKGAIAVMECDTGKLRAVCSFPDYPQDDPASVLESEGGPLLNRAFSPYAVGSAFKVVTAADAYLENAPFPDHFNCTASIDIGGVTFHCHNDQGHGLVDSKRAMMVSCNPYFITLGQQLSPDRFLQTARDCGFGKQTTLANGIISSAGKLPSLDELSLPAGLANFSFGQGTFTGTPVQLAQMMSTVTNSGVCPTPSLVEGETDGTQLPQSTPSASSRAFSADIADVLRETLIACLSEQQSGATPLHTTAGGKTSTAQTGSYENGQELCNGWFVGFFPAEQHKYAVAIVVEDAEAGNVDAAPVFREIADGWATLSSR